MSAIQQFVDEQAVDEDEVFIQQLEEYYGRFLSNYTLLFAQYRGNKYKVTLALFSLDFFLYGGFLVILLYSIMIELNDLQLASIMANYALLLLFCILIVFFANYYRKEMAHFHRVAAGDMGVYLGRRIYDEKPAQKIQLTLDRIKKQLLVLPIFFCVVGTLLFATQTFTQMNANEVYTENGVNRILPLPMFFPFPTEQGVGYLMAVLTQLILAASVIGVFIHTALIIIIFLFKTLLELRILGYALDTLFERAARLGKERNRQDVKLHTSDPLLQRCVGLIIRDCVIHHMKIKEYIGIFNVILKWPAAALYSSNTGAIGLSLISILSAFRHDDIPNLILFSLILIAEVASTYLLSAIGEAVTAESEKLREKLYEMEWYRLDVLNRKMMLNFQVGLTEPDILKAGGLVTVSLDTFSTIINTAYSFFNIVYARL